MQEAGTAASGATRARGGVIQWAPVGVGVLIALIITWYGYSFVTSAARGEFAYALDDAYIHLAIAKNVVQHGVWGVTPYQTTAAGSSPLWAMLLAGVFVLTGVRDWMPLILNILFLVASVLTFDGIARRLEVALPWRAVLAGAFVIGIPYLALAFSGMEHMLHTWLMLLFAGAFLDALLRSSVSKRQMAVLFLLGFFATLARYESAFLFLGPVYFAWKDKRPEFAMPLAGAVLAVVLFGLYSVSVGMPFIPGTMALKGVQGYAKDYRISLAESIQTRLWLNFVIGLSITLPTVGALGSILAAWNRSEWARPFFISLGLGFLLHYTFSSTLQLFRYEAYLFALALLVLAIGISAKREDGKEDYYELVAALFIGALLLRGYEAIQRTPQASKNIYDQQIQMARFIKQNYAGGTVALNDLGAVSFYGDVHVVDLFGLASNDVKELKLAGKFNTEAMREIFKKRAPDVIVVYPEWFQRYGGLPPELKEVSTWHIPNNVIAAYADVTFYALPGAEVNLRRALRRNEPNLPHGVHVIYGRRPVED